MTETTQETTDISIDQFSEQYGNLRIINPKTTMIFKRLKVKWMVFLWVVGAVVFVGLMLGNVMGLPAVQTVKWNGLPVFLLLAVFSLAAAFPLGILLALARHQNDHLLLRSLASGYIELIRGVTLLTVLFMGLFILPMIMPRGFFIEPLFAILIALMLFHAAYFAGNHFKRTFNLGVPAGPGTGSHSFLGVSGNAHS